jgi:hypothetical protein
VALVAVERAEDWAAAQRLLLRFLHTPHAPLLHPPTCNRPRAGNVNTQDPNWLKIVLRNGNACGYLWEANTHYYP